ncbi:MAG TPA: nuclear transport factor 2 family protein [Candidatus Binataceae bacterium]|nr:nuclear transport factor 2 family protein [Candidatus Binataceae bacterium]
MAADLEARVKELEGKVQAMTDCEAIRNLRYRYHEYVNEGKFKEIPSLFVEDGELDFAHLGKAKGHAEIAKFYGGIVGDGPVRDQNRPRISWVKQFIHNHMIELHGDHGHGVSYLEAKPIYGGEAFLVAARFNDDYVKRNGEWKFKKMSLLPYFMVPLKEGWAQEDKLKMR